MCSLHEDSFFLDSSVGATRWTCEGILCFDVFLEAMFTPLTPFPTVSLSVESSIRDMLCQYFTKFVCFVSMVSHKKSYLVCVELSNFRILRNIYFDFFSTYKTETTNRAETAA